jgi:hypothetical protein
MATKKKKPAPKKVASKRKAAKRPALKARATPAKRTLICVPCGREVVMSREGVASSILLCCGEAMQDKK